MSRFVDAEQLKQKIKKCVEDGYDTFSEWHIYGFLEECDSYPFAIKDNVIYPIGITIDDIRQGRDGLEVRNKIEGYIEWIKFLEKLNKKDESNT